MSLLMFYWFVEKYYEFKMYVIIVIVKKKLVFIFLKIDNK